MAAGDQNTKLSVPKFSSFKHAESKPSLETQKRRRQDEAKEDEKLKAPKFSSFKSEEQHPTDARRRSRRDNDCGEDEDGHRHDKHRHRSHSQKRDILQRDTSRREKEHQGSRRQKPKPEPDPVSSVPGLFVIDTKGDPLITRYGADRYRIPSYYRYGGGRILGTSGRLVIHRDGPLQTFSLLFHGERLSGNRDRDGLRSRDWLKRRPVKLRARRIRPDDEDDDEDFLSLESPRKRRKRNVNSDSSDGEDPTPWRSIEAKVKAGDHQVGDGEEKYSSSSASDGDDPVRWKSSQLHRRVKDYADDIDAWLELVNHQDLLLSGNGASESGLPENAARSLAEVKVHLLESALLHASRPEDRERVLVGLMREGGKVWKRDATSKRWAQISEDEHRSFLLWRVHIDYAMSSIATVQFEDIKTMMVRRLHDVCSRSDLGSSEDLAEAIYVFLRATKFIHDAGYKELAVAAWQGLLEFNLFRPDSVESQAEALAAFRDFWESEVPRLGEPGAQGWRQYVQSGVAGDVPDAAADDEAMKPPRRDTYEAWATAERLCGRKAAMPARTMDAGTDDDPFRVVMCSDIEPLLFLLPRGELVNVTQQLMDAYLLFCGLPPAFRSSEWTDMAWNDQYIVRSRPNPRLQPIREVEAEEQDDSRRKRPMFDGGCCHARISASLLFSGNSWFQYVDVADEEQMVDMSWVETTLKQLIYSANISALALYYLGIRFVRDASSIKKHAKGLLKLYPTDVQLFNSYALAELAAGNVELAEKVLASALGSPTLASASTGFLLFKTWSWLELQRGDKHQATRRLCASVDESLRGSQKDGVVVSASAVLKARQAFAANCRRCLYEGDQETASCYMECLALLSYLKDEGGSEPASTAQGNISAAMEAFASISKDVEFLGGKCEKAHELMLQAASRMLYFHSTRGPFRRAFMREQLANWVEKYRQNTIFMSLFAWADTGSWVKDETRRLLADKVLTKAHDGVSSRISAIGHELARGNVHSARTALEQAVSSEACRSSVGLWLWYVRFCKQKLGLEAGRRVLYRALGCCPWSKDVMMEAFGMGLEEGELRGVYEGMVDKGLRVHVELDGLLSGKGGEVRRGEERRGG
ncbi:hypothetical protein L249_6420 [Ophiocordyceps polyrhachis-furcata BCC 54312]|uniref:DUF1740-domain-containing protein n=1 Tax=Ophiocordyceps polyrhachis-furcata BCC 54312 TaxID=1330021 RepID=A0A367LLM8_9HYPO|nr:hypothetical protein L249_6420 [Ophiocordyceps polyrhachis-furcata BCC 54312]